MGQVRRQKQCSHQDGRNKAVALLWALLLLLFACCPYLWPGLLFGEGGRKGGEEGRKGEEVLLREGGRRAPNNNQGRNRTATVGHRDVFRLGSKPQRVCVCEKRACLLASVAVRSEKTRRSKQVVAVVDVTPGFSSLSCRPSQVGSCFIALNGPSMTALSLRKTRASSLCRGSVCLCESRGAQLIRVLARAFRMSCDGPRGSIHSFPALSTSLLRSSWRLERGTIRSAPSRPGLTHTTLPLPTSLSTHHAQFRARAKGAGSTTRHHASATQGHRLAGKRTCAEVRVRPPCLSVFWLSSFLPSPKSTLPPSPV